MRLDDAIRQRRSVRGFLPDEVPREVLREVFELAQWTPSNCNVQPWIPHVVSGKPLAVLRIAPTPTLGSDLSRSKIAAALADSESGSINPPPLTALGALGARNPPTTTSATSQTARTTHRQRTMAQPQVAQLDRRNRDHRAHATTSHTQATSAAAVV